MITTYAEWLATRTELDRLLDEQMRLLESGDLDGSKEASEQRRALDERMPTGDPAELLRAVWLVDIWDRSCVPPEIDSDGEVLDIAWNNQRGDSVTTAQDIRWLVDLLLAELRKHRPDLRPAGAP